jgi:hypothetical protein
MAQNFALRACCQDAHGLEKHLCALCVIQQLLRSVYVCALYKTHNSLLLLLPQLLVLLLL